MAMIEVRNLVKSFGAARAVDDVSFDVDRGEIVGLLGPNGAGKSTTMRIITNFISCDSGSARVAGHDVFSEPIEARRQIGYLPESTPLYLDMGIVEFLEFVCDLRGIHGARRRERLAHIIEVCGLAPEITKVIGELSKGYRQRVGLAQAMIHDPEILILDEPSTGLDPNQIVDIRAMIKRLGKEKTILVSTHNLSEVSILCDRALIINKGRLVADGAPSELQARSQGGTLFVAASGPRSAISGALTALEGVAEARVVEELGEGCARFALRRLPAQAGAAAMDWRRLAEAISRLAAERGWAVSELRFEPPSLEEVFRQLTMDAAN